MMYDVTIGAHIKENCRAGFYEKDEFFAYLLQRFHLIKIFHGET